MSSPETAVLGCIMQDAGLVAAAYSRGLRPESFSDRRNAELFRTMVVMQSNEEPIDHVTLHARLFTDGNLASAGDSGYVASIGDELPHTGNFDSYVDYIKIGSVERKLAHGLAEINAILTEKGGEDALIRAEQILTQISTETYSGGFVRANGIVDDIVLRLEEGALTSFGIPTGFVALDRITNGLHPGGLYIIAGRPAMGKTSLALNIAHHAAGEGKHAGIVSLEMSEEELGFRLLSEKTGLSQEFIKRGIIGQHGWSNIAKARKEIASYPLYIEDYGGITLYELQSNVRRLRSEHGLDLLVVDYLQLMDSGRGQENRTQEIGEITRGLKRLAKSMSIPIIALSQLNRGVESRAEPRPVLSDLRESGNIEQDADVVIFIYNPSYYNHDNQNISDIIIAKNRNGRTGTVKLKWEPEITTFKDIK